MLLPSKKKSNLFGAFPFQQRENLHQTNYTVSKFYFDVLVDCFQSQHFNKKKRVQTNYTRFYILDYYIIPSSEKL